MNELSNTSGSKLNTEEFIKRANLIHNNKYDYSKTNYISFHKYVTIICKFHNQEFYQRPSKHLSGQGCKRCKINLKNS